MWCDVDSTVPTTRTSPLNCPQASVMDLTPPAPWHQLSAWQRSPLSPIITPMPPMPFACHCPRSVTHRWRVWRSRLSLSVFLDSPSCPFCLFLHFGAYVFYLYFHPSIFSSTNPSLPTLFIDGDRHVGVMIS